MTSTDHRGGATALALADAGQLPRIRTWRGRYRLDLRPRRVRRWLAELPLGSPATRALVYFEFLREAESLSLKPRQRLEFLEALGPAVDATIASVRYTGGRHPAPAEEARRAVALAGTLARQIAGGYRRVLAHPARVGRRHTALALQRCAYYHGLLLRECYFSYQSPPEGAWRRLHELYRDGEHRSLQRVPVPGVQPGSTDSLEQCYKQVLLFAAAAPQRLRPGELQQLQGLVGQVADRASLLPPGQAAEGEGYLIDLEQDGPPLHRTQAALSGGELRVLDWRPALEPAVATAGAALEPEAREWLQELLARPPGRRHPRRLSRRSVLTVFGLVEIVHLLAREHGLSLRLQAGPDEALSVTAHGEDAEAHYDQVSGTWEILHGSALVAEPPPGVGPRAAREPFRVERWQVLDTSAGGYRLAVSGSAPTARVGEVVALRESELGPDGRWQIGLVRWLRHAASGSLELGVHLLGAGALPTAVQPPASAGALHVAEALLLPAMPVLGQPARLITPRLPYVSGLRVRLRADRQDHDILLGREREATGSVRCFEFERAGGAAVELAAVTVGQQ